MALAAICVFTAVLFYNNRTEPAYIAKVHAATLAETVHHQPGHAHVGGVVASHNKSANS